VVVAVGGGIRLECESRRGYTVFDVCDDEERFFSPITTKRTMHTLLPISRLPFAYAYLSSLS